MPRTMYDSIALDNLPAGADLYAGYDDGNWPDAAAIALRFPGKTVLRVTVDPADNEGDMLDVEKGDATPPAAPGWVQRRRTAGHGGPLVYCNFDSWPTVRSAFAAQHVAEPGYVVAGYPGPVPYAGPVIPPAPAVGHQYASYPTYDVSVMADYLPGIDPEPPAPAEEEDPVKFGIVSYQTQELWLVGVGSAGIWKRHIATPEDLTTYTEKLGATPWSLSAAEMATIPTVEVANA